MLVISPMISLLPACMVTFLPVSRSCSYNQRRPEIQGGLVAMELRGDEQESDESLIALTTHFAQVRSPVSFPASPHRDLRTGLGTRLGIHMLCAGFSTAV